jgi:chemotaxis protein MotB
MARSRRRHEEHEEHVNHERWLVSYADMMTLLMVLFIVMFAISQVDQRRFDQLKEGMAAGFGATASPFQGSEATLEGEGASPIQPIAPDAQMAEPSKVDVKAAADKAKESSDQDYQQAAREVARLEALRQRIAKALAAKGYLRDVSMRIDERGLTISLVSRHIVFRANEAELSPRGKSVLSVLAPVIRTLPDAIAVDGHTNQIKVKPKYYPTDWELSAARAVTVLRYLTERGDVSAARLTAVAFGHERPLRDPDLPGAAALNKRVDLVVVSDSPESTRKLFTKVLADHQNRT